MTQVNLLPPEIRQRAIVRRNTFLVGAAGVLLIALMVFLYIGQASRLADVNKDIAEQDATNASLQQQAAGLAEFATLKAEADAKQIVLKEVYANEVAMSSLMQDVSDVMPSDAFLTSMAVTVSGPGAGTLTPSGTTTYIGTVTFGGSVYRLDTFPIWLDRIGSIEGFENPFVGSYTESAAGSLLYQFTSGADISEAALTDRGSKGNAALAAAGVTG
ncbi:MAG: type pilus assembly protein PilN [Actinomycetota bacterium]|jgi:Tfp pilus assembly protein PilN|nr:type pilus assembly protein PilN [Actinomycetota bacterium]